MHRLILINCHVIFLYLLWFSNCSCFINGIQDMKQTTWNVDYFLSRIQEMADEEIEKAEFCKEANITNLVRPSEDNVIKVIFRLHEKFQHCFEYFKISLEKKGRVIKEVSIPFLRDRQKPISYRFENVSCGIYEVFVQPCFNDRSCPLIRWPYEKSINVTSQDCISYSQKKTVSDDKIKEKLIIISSITALIFLTAIYELISYCYLSGKQKPQKVGDKSNVPEHEYVKVDTTEDIKTEIKSIHIYIFHSYDERNIIKSEVDALKDHLKLLLKYLFDTAKQEGRECPSYSNIKTIDSELSKILYNVNDWLDNALNENVDDGCLRKIIWIGSEIDGENDDNLENVIFSDFKDKIKSKIQRCLHGYDNLFVVRLHGIHAFSGNLENIVSRSRYYISTRLVDLRSGSGLVTLVDLCLNLCSGSGLVASKAKEKLKICLLQCLTEHVGSVQDA